MLQVNTDDLKKGIPRIRLIFCTSSLGMGFDSPSIDRVIHCKPPRCIYLTMSSKLEDVAEEVKLHQEYCI